MTRRKDKLKQKQDYIKKSLNESKSRVYQRQEEIKSENKLLINEKTLLKQIDILPVELIRIIYSYMSGNAKLFCNLKYNYLDSRFDIFDNLSIIEKLSKKNLLDLIYKGVLQKYPNIIESVSNYYYNSNIEEYIDVCGFELINLWKNNNLIDVNDNYGNITYEQKVQRLESTIKVDLKDAIYFYIVKIINLFYRTKRKVIYQKKYFITENTLFIELDKVFYLYKCIEKLTNFTPFLIS